MTIINSITGGSESKEPKLQQKTVIPGNANQTVLPDSEFDGLQYVSIMGSNNLVATNVKYGKNIFGVVGTYEHTSSRSYYIYNPIALLPFTSKTSLQVGVATFVGQDDAPTIKPIQTTGDISGKSSWSYSLDNGFFSSTYITSDSSGYDAEITIRTCTMTCSTNLPDGSYTVGLSTFSPVGCTSTTLQSNLHILYAIKPTLSRYNMTVSNRTATISNVKFTVDSSKWGNSDFSVRNPKGITFKDSSGNACLMFAAQVNYFSK